MRSFWVAFDWNGIPMVISSRLECFFIFDLAESIWVTKFIGFFWVRDRGGNGSMVNRQRSTPLSQSYRNRANAIMQEIKRDAGPMAVAR